MATADTLWLISIAFGASTLGGILGMASGIFIVPLLTIFGKISIHEAIGGSVLISKQSSHERLSDDLYRRLCFQCDPL